MKVRIIICSILICFAQAITWAGNVVTFVPNKSFDSQIKTLSEGSTAVIVSDFNLGGKAVTIPKNCTLNFNGGSVSNGTITFQNNRLTGDPRLYITPRGKLQGTVVVNWFGLQNDNQAFDNAPIFNKVGQVFDAIYVEPGDYYCKSPIDWSNNVISILTIDGNLIYSKSNSSDSFITIRTTRGIVNINGSIIGPTPKIADNNTKERSTGITFKDCNNSKIFVKTVGQFYKNILVTGSSTGVGNAYNDYEFVESYGAKVLVHLGFDNKGWNASNVFRMLRLTTYGGYTMPETGLLMQGKGDDEGGSFSDVVIDKLCIEGLKQSEPIKIIGANRFVIENVRNEDNYPVLCYCENVISGRIQTNYGSVTVRPNNQTEVGLITSTDFDEYSPLENSVAIDNKGQKRLYNSVDADLKSSVRYSPLSYTPVGIVSTSAVLGQPLRIQCAQPFVLDVVYYDSNKKVIAINKDGKEKPAGNIIFTKSNVTTNGYMTSSQTRDLTFVCPKVSEKVAYVGFFLRTNGSDPNPTFRLSRQISANAVPTIMKQ